MALLKRDIVYITCIFAITKLILMILSTNTYEMYVLINKIGFVSFVFAIIIIIPYYVAVKFIKGLENERAKYNLSE